MSCHSVECHNLHLAERKKQSTVSIAGMQDNPGLSMCRSITCFCTPGSEVRVTVVLVVVLHGVMLSAVIEAGI